MNTIKVILKTEVNPFTKQEQPILFLPNTPANAGLIAFCSPTEGHGEACFEYYYKCNPLKDEKEAARLLGWYDSIGAQKGEPDYIPVVRAYRQSAKDRTQNHNF